jgi:hypothetical protein
LVGTVGVLLSAGLDNDAEVLEDTLRGVLESLTTTADGSETIILATGGGSGSEVLDTLNLGGLGSRGGSGLLLDVAGHELILIGAVLLDQRSVLLVVLLDLLLNGVEPLAVAGVHLLVRGLLLGDGLIGEVFELGNGLDVNLGGRAGDLEDLAVEVIELCNS